MKRATLARAEIETDHTEYQQFVVNSISMLISGQERVERMLGKVLKREQSIIHSSDVSAKHHVGSTSESNSGHPHLQRARKTTFNGSGEEESVQRARKTTFNESHEEEIMSIELEAECVEEEDATTEDEPQRSALARSRDRTLSEIKLIAEEPTERRWPATLDPDWPRSLKRRHGKDESDSLVGYIQTFNSTRLSGFVSVKHKLSLAESPAALSKRWRFKDLILTPTHPIRLVLDLSSVICLCYDLLTIPCFLAWGVEPEGLLKAIQYAVMMYWTLDIVASFRTGYIAEGEVVKDSKKIVMRYLKGNFAMEFAIVFIDWLSFVFEASREDGGTSATDGTARVLRMGKLYRLLRLLGIIRMTKVMTAFHRIADRNASRNVQLGLEIFKLLITIVYINHVLGCVWYAISKYEYADTGAHWTDLPIAGGGGRYTDTTAFFQYSTAIHWSLTQMTPGSMQINAQNSLERSYNIFCLVFGVLFFSSLISTLSAKMVQMQMLNQSKVAKISMMMAFLRERNVGSSMTYLIKQQVLERMGAKAPLLQHNVEALRLISAKLQAEVHLVVCAPLLSTHTILLTMMRLDKEYFTQVCFRAMDFFVLSRLDTLFTAGLECNGAYVISRGSLNYTQRPETSLAYQVHTCTVHSGTWLCEAAMWSEWIHVGTAECCVTLEILKIDSDQLVHASARNFLFKQVLFEYGTTYFDRLCSLPRTAIPTDMCDEAIQCSQIISTSSPDLQMLVSCVSFEIMAGTWKWNRTWKGISILLQEEVRMGQTTLIPISDDSIRRCVHVSCLKLCRDDGSTFVELGIWDDTTSALKIDLRLPGSKLSNYEGPESALARVLNDRFRTLKDAIVVEEREDKTEIRPSPKYMIDTQYTKYVYEASFDPECPLPATFISSPPLSVDDGFSAQPGEMIFYCDLTDRNENIQVYAWISPELFEELFESMTKKADCLPLQTFDIEKAAHLEDVCSQPRGVNVTV